MTSPQRLSLSPSLLVLLLLLFALSHDAVAFQSPPTTFQGVATTIARPKEHTQKRRHQQTCFLSKRLLVHDDNDDDTLDYHRDDQDTRVDCFGFDRLSRRDLLNNAALAVTSGITALVAPGNAKAAGGSFNNRKQSLLLIQPREGTREESKTDPVDYNDLPDVVLSSERCLLKLLPVKNNVFRSLEGYVESLSSLRGKGRKKRHVFVAATVVCHISSTSINQTQISHPIAHLLTLSLFVLPPQL